MKRHSELRVSHQGEGRYDVTWLYAIFCRNGLPPAAMRSRSRKRRPHRECTQLRSRGLRNGVRRDREIICDSWGDCDDHKVFPTFHCVRLPMLAIAISVV
jgi:hypothetical protein